MKLKTEMKRCSDGYVCVSMGMEMQTDREHDAAYAHALVKALNEHAEDFTACWSDDPVEFAPWVFERAAEIMAEWGYRHDKG